MVPAGGGRRIGLFGGTFDPVHNGHLAVARAATSTLGLDRLIFVPAAMPPHKQSPSSFDHRLAMLALVAGQNPLFAVSDLEARRLGPSYTVETLAELRKDLGWTVDLYFIMGADAFAEIGTWREHRRLLDFANLVVANRPQGYSGATAATVRDCFSGMIAERDGCWREPRSGNRIFELDMAPVAVCSTDVRHCAARGGDLSGLVPSAVARYIADHHLYQP